MVVYLCFCYVLQLTIIFSFENKWFNSRDLNTELACCLISCAAFRMPKLWYFVMLVIWITGTFVTEFSFNANISISKMQYVPSNHAEQYLNSTCSSLSAEKLNKLICLKECYHSLSVTRVWVVKPCSLRLPSVNMVSYVVNQNFKVWCIQLSV